MSRRERRDRIVTAFEALRSTIAAALGAAVNAREAVEREHAQVTFERRLRTEGLEAVRADPELAAMVRRPDFAETVKRVLADRAAAFGSWATAGPDYLAELVAETAPGTASDPWESWLGTVGKADGSGPVPELWRIGTGQVDGSPTGQHFPVAVPLLDESHLEVRSGVTTRSSAETLVELLLMRVVSYFRPGMVALHVWDIGQFTGAMPGLYPLTRAGILTVHDPGRLGELLDELSDHIRRVHARVLLDGHPSLRELAAASGTRSEPWQIAVLVGRHNQLGDDDRRALQRIARNGLACGIQLVLLDVPVMLSAPLEYVELIDPEDMGHPDSDLVLARSSMTAEHVTIVADQPAPRDRMISACHLISDELERVRSRIGTFGDLVPLEREQWWTERSTNGVSAPIGFRDGRHVELRLCDASPHALIGGPSGSGKTNFLLAMIGSMAARYSPDELELYLLDFKEGVSFAQFTPGRRDPSWLPHARLVGVNINTDREFGLALLRFLAEEMRRRAEAAKSHEVSKLEELRDADPTGRWPRVVAVIDEFQYLFSGRDQVTTEATALLEDVARRGRSQGIHLVLCSQDVSGIEAFWGRPAIFEQFVLRVALPRARRVLAELNDVALTLPRWHAVLNHESGMKHGNETARVPDATAPGTVDSLRGELWRQRPARLGEPRLFDANRVPKLADLTAELVAAREPEQPPCAVLGQLIDVTSSAASVPMIATPGRNVAVVSSSAADGAAVLGAAALSLAEQHEPGTARFTVVAVVPDSHPPVERLAARLRALGHPVRVEGLSSVAALVAEMASDVADRLVGGAAPDEAHYVLLYGVDGASGVLEQKDPTTFRSGTDSLRQVLKSGPETGLHVLGWWRSVQRLRAVLTMGAGVDDIGCWVACDVQGAELGSLAPGVVQWAPRPGRGLMFDRYTQRRPEVLIIPDLADSQVRS